jgi:hypothetical protein
MNKVFRILLVGWVLFFVQNKAMASFLEYKLLCKTIKVTSQQIPHLFEPSKVLNGTTEFSYHDQTQFNAELKRDNIGNGTLRTSFINNYGQLINHSYTCEQTGSNLNMTKCTMSPLDNEYVITFGNFADDKVKFIRYGLVTQWLLSEHLQSFMRVEVGACVVDNS